MKYAITLASFRKIEPIEDTLAVLTKQGYDAIEMFGEPTEVDRKKLLDSLKSYSLAVCGVTGMWGSISSDGWKRRLLSSDPSLVEASEQYVLDCLKLCNTLGGHEMNVCLFADDIKGVDKTHNIISANEKELFAAKAVPIMKSLCKSAVDYGIQLVLEPLNRYSTPYCATANNNRKMPGFAHIDFSTIVKSLNRIDYDGFISFEPNIADKNYVHAIKYGLDFVKRMVEAQN
jgi:sugar phosphate isomerase/epimerase